MDAKDDAVVLRAIEARIGSEEPIPDRKYCAVVGVRLLEHDRVVDAMHVHRNQHRLQGALQPLRQADIAMLHRGGNENRKSVAYDGSHRDIKGEHGKPVNRGAWDVLKWMMAHRCRHVDIGIGMVQRMKAPKERHCVLAPMNEVTNEVEQQKGRNQAQPGIADRPGWQGEALPLQS